MRKLCFNLFWPKMFKVDIEVFFYWFWFSFMVSVMWFPPDSSTNLRNSLLSRLNMWLLWWLCFLYSPRLIRNYKKCDFCDDDGIFKTIFLIIFMIMAVIRTISWHKKLCQSKEPSAQLLWTLLTYWLLYMYTNTIFIFTKPVFVVK